MNRRQHRAAINELKNNIERLFIDYVDVLIAKCASFEALAERTTDEGVKFLLKGKQGGVHEAIESLREILATDDVSRGRAAALIDRYLRGGNDE